jgi:hypothetical protein
LTVPNAVEVKDFYAKVVGWMPEGLSMGDYELQLCEKKI